ncbi:MAG: ABC transporter permease [Steroidobacteraceae bacterium]
MVGLHATYDHLIETSRVNRLGVNARFPQASAGGILLPTAVRDQIAKVQGVSAVGSYYWLWGYYQDPHRRARIIAVDDNMRAAWSELPVTAAQWDPLFSTSDGVLMSRGPAARLGMKPGDSLPLIAPGTRADGAEAWEFKVLAVVPDDPRTGPYILGNYGYLDRSRPVAQQGTAWGFRVAVRAGAPANQVGVLIDQQLANSGTPTLTIPDQVSELDAVNSGLSVASKAWPVAGAGIFMILLLTANGLAQSVRERTAEFAVLRTVGYRHGILMALVFAEVALPCVAGAFVGTELARVLAGYPRITCQQIWPICPNQLCHSWCWRGLWVAPCSSPLSAPSFRCADCGASASPTLWRTLNVRVLRQTLVLSRLGLAGLVQRQLRGCCSMAGT